MSVIDRLRIYKPRWVSRSLWAPRHAHVEVKYGRGKALFVVEKPDVLTLVELEEMLV